MKQTHISGCVRLEFSGEQTIQELLLQILIEKIEEIGIFDGSRADR